MLADILSYATVSNLGIGVVVFGIIAHLFIRFRYEFRLTRAGGMHAGKLASNSLTALPWMWAIGMAQARNDMLSFFRLAVSKSKPTAPNLVELNVTGGQRFLFTQDPEHTKAILTGKFADFGKGEEFHRGMKYSPF